MLGSLCQLFLFLHFQIILSSSSSNLSSTPSPKKLCSPQQSFALLHFKNNFSYDCSSHLLRYSYPEANSWKEDTDCCSWEGVTCDSLTGHVIGLDLVSRCLAGPIDDNSSLFQLHHLQKLNLAFNAFNGSIPASLWNMTEIIDLDLSANNFIGKVPTSISKLRELTSLNLGENSFSGPFPDVFNNFSKLTHLFLHGNEFSGRLPSSAFNLPQLSELDFSYNQFDGQIPLQVSGYLDLISLPSLQYLNLENNKLSGPIPNSMFDLPSLQCLNLKSNKLSGPIPNSMFDLPSLQFLYLDNNKLSGPIPNSLFDLVNITELDLSSNNLSGILKSDMFSQFKNLIRIDLSHNSLLSLTPYSKTNFTLPNLEEFRFSSCNLTKVPVFLMNSNNLQKLDLSNNRISGRISVCEFQGWQHFSYLNLSHNFLISFEQLPSTSMLLDIDLRSNLLQGSLFDLPTENISFFSVANNKLTGEIPSSFCNSRDIKFLSLSNNSLNGTIPQCLGNSSSSLVVLDLQMNNFHGRIPQSFAKGTLGYLSLYGNQLEGPLPHFHNSSALRFLDVGNNKINDTFPHWLASLTDLKVLILRSNKFHGPINISALGFPFPKLQILDLSHNQFTGLLPRRYFGNFAQGPHDNDVVDYMGNYAKYVGPHKIPDTSQYYSIILVVKGVEREMDRVLSILKAIDLSNNQFEGGIPGSVFGKFNSLKVLNLSHNKLIDHIPSSLENLTDLESLDLSSNKFTGEIPKQLASLTFLSVLNLSYNQFVGPIPQGKQFNTFQNDSFIGNLELCGLPLSKKCGYDKAHEHEIGLTTFYQEDNISSWFDWKVALMGYGCGLVIGLSMGYIVFTIRRPRWFLRMVEMKQLTKARRLRGRQTGRRNW